MSAQERILLVRLSHLGDVVHALPVYHALRAGFPDARLAWAVQGEFAALVEGLAGLERCVRFDRRGGARAWLALREELCAFSPTLAVDAQGNLKSALVTLASGAPRRVGLARVDWREPLGALAMTERAPPAGPGRVHALDRMLSLARHVGGPAATTRHDPALSPAELERGRAALRSRLAPGPGDVLLQLARADDVRSWPPEHFESLARGLARAGRSVLLLSGPAEEALGRELERRLGDEPRVRHWVGQRGLRELAAALTAAAEARARFVGCDSGPLHLAVACGMTVLALSGPQDPARTGPWPVPAPFEGPPARASVGPHSVLRAQPAPPCAPCLARACSHPRGPVCMHDLDPDRVLRALLAPA